MCSMIEWLFNIFLGGAVKWNKKSEKIKSLPIFNFWMIRVQFKNMYLGILMDTYLIEHWTPKLMESDLKKKCNHANCRIVLLNGNVSSSGNLNQPCLSCMTTLKMTSLKVWSLLGLFSLESALKQIFFFIL